MEDREEELTRQDRVDLARFRSGHHPALGRWMKMVGLLEDSTCRLCGREEETSEHLWLRCESLEERRMGSFVGRSYEELFVYPVRAVAFLRCILSRLK